MDHTAEEIAAYDAQYQVLAGEVDDLLDDTVYDGTTLLSGRDPLVPLRLNSGSITSMELDDLPEGAMESISLAMSEIAIAKVDLESRTNSLTSSITDLQTHADELSGFENRLTTAAEAMAVLALVTTQMVREVIVGASAQANVSAFMSLQLLSA